MGTGRRELEAQADRLLAAAAPAQRPPTIASDPELERAIERSPADDELRRAYALQLERIGDARGILARLRPGARQHAFVRQHATLLFGDAAEAAADKRRLRVVSWRFGFATAARANLQAVSSSALAAFLDAPACRFLERLVGTWRDEADDAAAKLGTAQRHVDEVAEALARARCARTMTVVELVSVDRHGQPADLAMRSLGPPAAARRRLTALHAFTARFGSAAPI